MYMYLKGTLFLHIMYACKANQLNKQADVKQNR